MLHLHKYNTKCNLLVITTFYSQYVKELRPNVKMCKWLNFSMNNADGKVMNLQTYKPNVKIAQWLDFSTLYSQHLNRKNCI